MWSSVRWSVIERAEMVRGGVGLGRERAGREDYQGQGVAGRWIEGSMSLASYAR